MKLLVPCVLLPVLFACVYSAPGPICICCRDDCEGFEEVDNSDVLVRVARSPAGGGDHGEDHGTGLKDVVNGDELVRVTRSLAGGGEHGEDHDAGFEEVDNGYDYGENIGVGSAGNGLECLPEDTDSLSVETILFS